MKRLLALLLVFTFVGATLVGCGDTKKTVQTTEKKVTGTGDAK